MKTAIRMMAPINTNRNAFAENFMVRFTPTPVRTIRAADNRGSPGCELGFCQVSISLSSPGDFVAWTFGVSAHCPLNAELQIPVIADWLIQKCWKGSEFIGQATRSRFGNRRYGRFGNMRYGAEPGCARGPLKCQGKLNALGCERSRFRRAEAAARRQARYLPVRRRPCKFHGLILDTSLKVCSRFVEIDVSFCR